MDSKMNNAKIKNKEANLGVDWKDDSDWGRKKNALQNAQNRNNLTLMSTQLEVTAKAIFAQPNATRILSSMYAITLL